MQVPAKVKHGFSIIILLFATAPVRPSEITFRVHPLNPESEYSACAVVDVDRDKYLDVVCGGWWYEAPTWKKHFVRHVRKIRGRYDGYSHLPMDVDGDGWTDIVNVNYRSQSLFWVKHPGQSLGVWTRHLIATPGPMETGRLVDVDGDGRPDILPNGVKFAAWWELEKTPDPGGSAHPKWTRHDLPPEVAAHGVGYGDINGDSRGDIVGPGGWLEAPTDPRRGQWQWHPEFKLDSDTGIPILVTDVDDDGDNDLVWGRGHNYGVYWLEQTHNGENKRSWVRHEIDRTWSQAHSLLWADLDGDGRGELITGKRYLAHDGRDPGAFDPLVIYRYQFDTKGQQWTRDTIASGSQVGFGLDPKVADLDADGDLDLVVCGRSGLYWLENSGHVPDQ